MYARSCVEKDLRSPHTWGHVAATCSSDKIMCCSHFGDMKQRRVTGTCSSNKIEMHTHTSNCSGPCPKDMSQRHVPSSVRIFFGTCNTNSCNILSLRHVARSSTSWIPCNMLQGQNSFKVCVAGAKNNQHTRGDVSLRHVPGTCPRYIFLRVYTLCFCFC